MQLPRILVVDDSESYLLFVRLVLSGSCDVELASSVDEALERARRRRPDLVLTDYAMPARSGLELVEAVRRRLPGVPIVLMSAAVPSLAAKRADALGVHAVVEKPFAPAELRELVSRALATASEPTAA